MSRNMKETADKVFLSLIKYAEVDSDNSGRIKTVNRWLIFPEELDKPLFDFITNSSDKIVDGIEEKFLRILYKDEIFILAPSNYEEVFTNIGLQQVNDKIIEDGCGIIAIAQQVINVKNELTPLKVIDGCLGIEPEQGETVVKFEIDEIFKFFNEFSVFEVENNAFGVNYVEDFHRIQAIQKLQFGESIINETTTSLLINLMQLSSSKSIAESIIIALKSQVFPHAFLEIYQCLEYLFVVHRVIKHTKKYSFDINRFVDFLMQENIRVPEKKDVIDIIREYISEEDLNKFLDIELSTDIDKLDKEKKVTKVAETIYNIRCNIAHLKYRQEELPEMDDMQKMIEKLSQIVFLVYTKMDSDIEKVCLETNIWESIG